LIGIGNSPLHHRAGGGRMHGAFFRACHQHAVRQAIGLLVMGIAHHQTVVLVPQDEGFRGGFDGVGKALVGFGVALRKAVLFGHIHGDADDARAVIGADDLGAGAQPDIMALGMAHAENLIDLAQVAAADGSGKLIEIAVFGMHHAGGVGEGKRCGLRRQPENFVERTGPEHAPAGKIEIPQPAAAARQRGFDPQVGFGEDIVGVAGALHLHVIGIEHDQQDRGDAGKQRHVHGDFAAPEGTDRLQRAGCDHHRAIVAEGDHRRIVLLAVNIGLDGAGRAGETLHDGDFRKQSRQRRADIKHRFLAGAGENAAIAA
jgi:hypothetical protein